MQNFIQESKFCAILSRFDFQEVKNGQKKERRRNRIFDFYNREDRSFRFSSGEFLLERQTFVEKHNPNGRRHC